MYKLLIDTCVWIDLAKDPSQHSLLHVLSASVKSNDVSLILPETILTEIARNRERLVKETNQSLSGTIKRVKDVVEKFGTDKESQHVIDHLNEVSSKLPLFREAITDALSEIEDLLNSVPIYTISNDIKVKAANRGIEKLAPFHRGKNSINDSILYECFLESIHQSDAGHHHIFVTHNKNDFSNSVDEKQAHPHLDIFFTKPNCKYFIKLSEALGEIRPDLVTEFMIENEFVFEVRNLRDIMKFENELFEKVWYTRHQILKHRYDTDILAKSEEYADEIEKRHGKENLGPWTDFEWGMINGKLSALRWITGDEWDMLDS